MNKEKIDLIKQYKEPTIAALNVVIDTYLDFNAPITNEKGNLMTAKFKDYKAQKFAEGIQNSISTYKGIRSKIIENNFDLSNYEIAYVTSAYVFCSEKTKNSIESLVRSRELMDEIIEKLSIKEELNEKENLDLN